MWIQKITNWFAITLIYSLSLDIQAQEDNFQEKIAHHTEYVYPVEGAAIQCPLVSLQGSLMRHTFPGTPNYESLENGDAPETRWILIIPESEIHRLTQAGFIPQEDIFCLEERGWVQLIAPHSENDPIKFRDKQVIVEGYLGSLAFHVHTPIAIEAIGIYDNQ
jgi:hypothetical protein